MDLLDSSAGSYVTYKTISFVKAIATVLLDHTHN